MRSLTLVLTLLAIATTTTLAQDLSLDDATKFYFGYVDALMNIDLQGQMTACGNVVPKA